MKGQDSFPQESVNITINKRYGNPVSRALLRNQKFKFILNLCSMLQESGFLQIISHYQYKDLKRKTLLDIVSWVNTDINSCVFPHHLQKLIKQPAFQRCFAKTKNKKIPINHLPPSSLPPNTNNLLFCQYIKFCSMPWWLKTWAQSQMDVFLNPGPSTYKLYYFGKL